VSGILVLGIGNILWADEGFGVRAAEALHRSYRLGPGVEVMDGGTQGLYLVPQVAACRRLLVLDAVDYGLPPGTLRQVRDAEVPRYMGAKKMSLHQTGFQEVLSAASLLGWAPEGLLLVGVQPAEIEAWGHGLSPVVAAALPGAVDAAVAQLTEWGGAPLASRRDDAPLLRHGLARADYERNSSCTGS
jgi:hydrogenase maturation protease